MGVPQNKLSASTTTWLQLDCAYPVLKVEATVELLRIGGGQTARLMAGKILCSSRTVTGLNRKIVEKPIRKMVGAGRFELALILGKKLPLFQDSHIF